ncbi:MAG: hypothetical protein H6621_01700 [Halobacteriovoraceae bacterium]|nr:hypothetical protein [Halobacteriovoraceae bacterium]MCB9093756.1 hypothetical protein [Halobacteriovoraceae bacterium]
MKYFNFLILIFSFSAYSQEIDVNKIVLNKSNFEDRATYADVAMKYFDRGFAEWRIQNTFDNCDPTPPQGDYKHTNLVEILNTSKKILGIITISTACGTEIRTYSAYVEFTLDSNGIWGVSDLNAIKQI